MKSSRPPLSLVLVDLGCLGFAAWTVVCNALVMLGANAIELAVACAIVLLGAAYGLGSRARRARLATFLRALRDDPDASTGVEPAHGALARLGVVRVIAFAAGELVVARFAQSGDRLELCGYAVAFFAMSYALLASDEPLAGAHRPRKVEEALLWTIAIGFAVLTLVAHRANSDDSFYVNMGVSVADFPNQPLLSRETLHGSGGPFRIAAYRATSIELLAGLLSYVTRLPTLAFAHMVIPATFALLTPLALARLFRVLDAERFLYAVAIVLVFLLFDGRGRGSFGTFAFTRLYQGKAVLCTFALPLLFAYGVGFAREPNLPRFAMLALAQIAALGTSVTAFWVAPIAVGFAVVAGLSWRRGSVRTLALGALSSAYLLGFGIFLKLQAHDALATLAKAAVDEGAGENAAPTRDLLAHAYEMVLGKPKLALPALVLVFVTWPLCRTSLARRFAVIVPLAFFAVLGNPKLTRFVAAITTEDIHWRVLWLLPVPVLAGLCFSSLLSPTRGREQLLRIPIFVCALVLFLELAPRYTLARSRFDWPHPKVDLRAYHVAQAVIRVLPAHSRVLAPLPVSRVLPMLNGYSYPLFIKPSFLSDDLADRALRKELTTLVAHPKGRSAQTLIDGIERYKVDGVVTVVERDSKHSLARALADAGFHLVASLERHQIWTRVRSR